MMKSYLLTAALFPVMMVCFAGCGSESIRTAGEDEVAVSDGKTDTIPGEGDLCSVVKDSTGRSFGVVKILKIEGDTYHLRTYGVSYDKRPSENDLEDIKSNHAAGIGHLPLSKEHFRQWEPEVILNQPVSLEELEGYNIWKNGQK